MSGTHYDDAFCVFVAGSPWQPPLPRPETSVVRASGFALTESRNTTTRTRRRTAYIRSTDRSAKFLRLPRYESIPRGILISPERALRCLDKSLCSLAGGDIPMFDVCNARKAHCVGNARWYYVYQKATGYIYILRVQYRAILKCLMDFRDRY